MSRLPIRSMLVALSLGLLACGGEIVGVGNSGNRLGSPPYEEVAEMLAKLEATPAVDDAMIERIFTAIAGRAERGEPEAALMILQLASKQREKEGE